MTQMKFGDISQEDLALLGARKFMYVRPMEAVAAQALFPDVRGLPTTGTVYVVHGANGAVIGLADSKNAARGCAIAEKLTWQSLH